MDGPLVPAVDAAAAEWVLASLREFGEGIGSIVPVCFEGYARVFHPAGLWVDEEPDAVCGAKAVRWPDGTMRWQKAVRWAEVAAANDRVMHPAAEWGSLTGVSHLGGDAGQPGIWDSQPDAGGPPPAVAKRLVAVLERFTDTPEACWFGISDIWGWPLLENLQRVPEFGSNARRYWLLSGPLRAALNSPHAGFGELADLWWPEDRRWFLGSDVDLVSTYVGGSGECIDAVVADDGLEALPVSIDQGVSFDTDTINPLPAPDASRPPHS